jgi:adenylosuccinate lyase
MKSNMELSQGQMMSSHLLLLLVGKGLSREEAYKHVQRLSHSLKDSESLYKKALKDKEVMSIVNRKELGDLFSGQVHLKAIRKTFERGMKGSK